MNSLHKMPVGGMGLEQGAASKRSPVLVETQATTQGSRPLYSNSHNSDSVQAFGAHV